MNILDTNKLQQVNTKVFGKNLIYYDELDSTNAEFMRRFKKDGLDNGTVIITARQLEGKGTGGNKWESNDTQGLRMSLVLHEPFAKNPLSFLPAVGLAKVLRHNYCVEAHLKWPNDVLVGNKKLAGILCQSATNSESETACSIGVGVNINQKSFPESVQHKAISLLMIIGKDSSIEEFYQLYVKELEETYNSNANIVTEWMKYTKMIDKKIKATKNKKHLQVTVKGVTESGYLKVEYDDGRIEDWVSSTFLDIDTDY